MAAVAWAIAVAFFLPAASVTAAFDGPLRDGRRRTGRTGRWGSVARRAPAAGQRQYPCHEGGGVAHGTRHHEPLPYLTLPLWWQAVTLGPLVELVEHWLQFVA